MPSEAIRACRDVLARSGSTFVTAFRILPAEQRDALTAFYAFCRAVDDDVDEVSDPAEARRRTAAWRERIDGIRNDRPARPTDRALGWAVRRFGIRIEHLDLVLDGVATDLETPCFERFDELYGYCYRVASAVGLVCVTVLLDGSWQRAERYAELTGIAVQLTNVVRDVGEDAAKGRVYLPAEDLRAFGVTEGDLREGSAGPAVARLLRFEARRAAEYDALAAAVLPDDLRGRLFFAETLRVTYRRLLDRMVSEGLPVLSRRVSLGKAERIAVALRHRLDPRTLLARGRAAPAPRDDATPSCPPGGSDGVHPGFDR
jgi:phytoene synthase